MHICCLLSAAAEAPPASQWLSVLAPIGSAVFLAVLGIWASVRLANKTGELGKAMQLQLESVRHGLQEGLVQRTRRAEYLRTQIESLYGPLAFLVESNGSLFAASADLGNVYTELYSGVRAGADGKELTNVIGVQNDYGELMIENNGRLEKLLGKHWGWLDGEDIEDVLRYLSNVIRQRVESAKGEDGRRKLPPELYNDALLKAHLKAPVIFRSDFATRIRRALTSKQTELSGLTGAAIETP